MVALLPAAAAGVRLLPLPEPALEPLEPASREQLEAARTAVDQLLAGDASSDGELAASIGGLGELYFLYDLMVPAAACFENARRLDPQDPAWPYFLGAVHTVRGEVEEAITALQTAANLDPGDAPTWVRLGRLHLDRDETDAARAAFTRALELQPDSAAAHEGLGRIARSGGDPRAALEHLERALELQPTATALHYQIGLAYRDLGDRDRARAELALNRHDPVLFRDPRVRRLARLARGARPYLEVGKTALQRGDAAAAVVAFEEAVAQDSEDPTLRYNLALARKAAGDPDGAERELRGALTLDPGYRDAHFNLGTLLAGEGRLEEAAAHFRRATEIDPLDREAAVQLAVVLDRLGDRQAALGVLDGVLAREPDAAPALLVYASILRSMDRRADARELLVRVAAEEGLPAERARAHVQLGEIERDEGRQREALEHFRRAAELDPGLSTAHAGAALAAGALGDFSAAAAGFARAVEMAPKDGQLRVGLSMALLMGGEYRRAAGALESGVEAVPDDLALELLWIRFLAAAPDASLRDPERALALASEIEERRPGLEQLETLAMAQAATGDFQAAQATQERAVEWAGTISPERREIARRRLELFRSGRAVVAPWLGGD